MTQAAFLDQPITASSLLPKIFHRQTENLPITSNFLPNHVRLPAVDPAFEASLMNLLSLNSQLLDPYMKHFLSGNQSRRPMHLSPSINHSPLVESHEVEETGELVKSIIEGETVMGFNVGGEVRLCLPHLLRFVLNDVDIDEIGQAISKLNIVCTKCSPSQLLSLHNCNALPSAVTSCGLIRKSDAERMLKFLRAGKHRPTFTELSQENSKIEDRSVNSILHSMKSENSSAILQSTKSDNVKEFIDIRHDCFGSQRGTLYPHLYVSPVSPCVLCKTCSKLFSPPDFVGHTHVVTELDRCCHWGFDSTNWRSYLRLDLHTSLHTKTESRSKLLSAEHGDSDTYRIFNEFKVKFLKPLTLPKALILKLSQLEKSSAKTPSDAWFMKRPLDVPLDCRKVKSSPTDINPPCTASPELCVLRATLTSPSSLEKDSTSTDTTSIPCPSLKCRLQHPNIKLSRLWAPHRGQLRIPNPPKLITDCPKGPKPSNLSTDGPILLDPSCVITKDSAHLYDRDFIPNVCLKPLQPADLSKSLSSVPSNDDISTTGKRSSVEDFYPVKSMCSMLPNTHRSRRRATNCDVLLRTVSKSCQGIYPTTNFLARTRHSSCAQELLTPPVTSKREKDGRDTLVALTRVPSADSLAEPFKTPLSRASSNPELQTTTVTVSSRMSWISSPSTAPTTTGYNVAGKRYTTHCSQDSSQQSLSRRKTEVPVVGIEPRPVSVSPNSESPNQKQTASPGFQISPDLMKWAMTMDPNVRIPNLVSHWVSMLERINTFCGALESSFKPSSSASFENERTKLFADLHSIQEQHFADLSMVLEENRKLWKLLADALVLSRSSQSLTPNTCAPPYGRTPGAMDQFSGFPFTQPSKHKYNRDLSRPTWTRPTNESRSNVNDRSKLSWRAGGSGGSAVEQNGVSPNQIAGADLNGAISAYLARQTKGTPKRMLHSSIPSSSHPPIPPGSESTNGEFLLTTKRQRLLL